MRDDPSLRGKPVAVAGNHRRSVVLTASYEARRFGVHSAMPLYRALEACPQLCVVAPQMAQYKEISREVFAIFGARGHALEGLSLDEAFIDLGDYSLAEGREFAELIRSEVRAASGLTVSAGVATGKIVAKIASDAAKPDGLLVIAPGDEANYLAPMPAGRLWGIGPKTQRRLAAVGVLSIGDVAALDEGAARTLFGSGWEDVRNLARGIDPRRVHSERETKSISSEETFEFDVRDEAQLLEALREQARDIAAKLLKEGCSAQTVGVKVKRANFDVLGRQTRLAEPTCEARRIFQAAAHCLRRMRLDGAPVRLLGTRVASLATGPPRQISLFAQPPH